MKGMPPRSLARISTALRFSLSSFLGSRTQSLSQSSVSLTATSTVSSCSWLSTNLNLEPHRQAMYL